MKRNVRTYDHFCLVARALECVGDRWSLLVVRDLLSGPKRFTDLADRLGGITPKTLTQRLRELQSAGLVTADRQPGRRQVWYELTPAGAELRPVVDGLAWWTLRHAWRAPRAGEALHPEHLLQAVVVVLDQTGGDRKPARWEVDLGSDGRYHIVGDDGRWTLCSLPGRGDGAPDVPAADVAMTATREQLLDLVVDPTLEAADDLGIELVGRRAAVRRFVEALRSLPESTVGSPTGG